MKLGQSVRIPPTGSRGEMSASGLGRSWGSPDGTKQLSPHRCNLVKASVLRLSSEKRAPYVTCPKSKKKMAGRLRGGCGQGNWRANEGWQRAEGNWRGCHLPTPTRPSDLEVWDLVALPQRDLEYIHGADEGRKPGQTLLAAPAYTNQESISPGGLQDTTDMAAKEKEAGHMAAVWPSSGRACFLVLVRTGALLGGTPGAKL